RKPRLFGEDEPSDLRLDSDLSKLAFFMFCLTVVNLGYRRPYYGRPLPCGSPTACARSVASLITTPAHTQSEVKLRTDAISVDCLHTIKTLILKRHARVLDGIKQDAKGAAAQRVSANQSSRTKLIVTSKDGQMFDHGNRIDLDEVSVSAAPLIRVNSQKAIVA